MDKPQYLNRKGGIRLAYHVLEGHPPGIVFLGGFRSDMTGNKATALEAFCRERGQAFVRFDYQGHGQSSGVFEECGIGVWLADALDVLAKLTKGPQILVGSSMGGWLALLLALEKPKRVAGIVGVAVAPDFTERLLVPKLSPAQRTEMKATSSIMLPSPDGRPHRITRAFLDDAASHCLLDHAELPIFCPVRLLHGMKDEDVPWEFSLAVNEKVMSKDVKTILVENGDHRLSKPGEIEKLLRVLSKLSDSLVGGA